MSQQTTTGDAPAESPAPARERLVDALWDNGTVLFALAMIALWEAVARFDGRRDIYFPSVGYTVDQTVASMDLVLQAIRVTFTEAVLAFLVAVVIGVSLGIVISESFLVRQLSMPMIIFIYSIPHAVLAPVFMIWFGTNLVGVVAFGAWVAFFPVFINTITGMTQLDEEFHHLGEVIGASRWQMLKYFKFWAALPNIASSVRVAVQLSIVGVIIAEFLASGSGLGFLIIKSTQRAQVGLTFGALIMIMVVAVVFYTVVDRLIAWVVPTEHR